MTRYVVDCSVAIQWYVVEDGYEDSRRLLDGTCEFIAPAVIVPEFANVCWKKLRRGEMTREEAVRSTRNLPGFLNAVVRSDSLVEASLAFAIDNDLSVYDSLYAVLALNTATPLVTHDRQLHASVLRQDPTLAVFPADLSA